MSVKKAIKEGKRIEGYYQIGIIFPDGKKIMKPRCTLDEALDTYFLNFDKLVSKNDSLEEILEKYKKTYQDKNIKVGINYIDSWSHKWTGKVAFPKDDIILKYLKKRINAN